MGPKRRGWSRWDPPQRWRRQPRDHSAAIHAGKPEGAMNQAQNGASLNAALSWTNSLFCRSSRGFPGSVQTICDEQDMHFNQLHARCGSRISSTRFLSEPGLHFSRTRWTFIARSEARSSSRTVGFLWPWKHPREMAHHLTPAIAIAPSSTDRPP